jgi:two-component system cell cycle response regulator DivK
MRILYVEDNPANLFLIKRVAKMGDHEVINLIDGEEALRKIDLIKPDLILMDIQLAGQLTGLDVVRKLRTDGYTMPIVAVTAYAMVGDRERCLEAGCNEYLSKPLPIGRVVELLQLYQAGVPAEPPINEDDSSVNIPILTRLPTGSPRTFVTTLTQPETKTSEETQTPPASEAASPAAPVETPPAADAVPATPAPVETPATSDSAAPASSPTAVPPKTSTSEQKAVSSDTLSVTPAPVAPKSSTSEQKAVSSDTPGMSLTPASVEANVSQAVVEAPAAIPESGPEAHPTVEPTSQDTSHPQDTVQAQ